MTTTLTLRERLTAAHPMSEFLRRLEAAVDRALLDDGALYVRGVATRPRPPRTSA